MCIGYIYYDELDFEQLVPTNKVYHKKGETNSGLAFSTQNSHFEPTNANPLVASAVCQLFNFFFFQFFNL